VTDVQEMAQVHKMVDRRDRNIMRAVCAKNARMFALVLEFMVHVLERERRIRIRSAAGGDTAPFCDSREKSVTHVSRS
jgi:hypothetical protein